jgi:hypothetical protein
MSEKWKVISGKLEVGSGKWLLALVRRAAERRTPKGSAKPNIGRKDS